MSETLTQTLPTSQRRGALGRFRSTHREPVVSQAAYRSYAEAIKVSKANNQRALELLIASMPSDAIAGIVEHKDPFGNVTQEEMSATDILQFYTPCQLTVVRWLNGNEELESPPYAVYPADMWTLDHGHELEVAMYAMEYDDYRDYMAVGMPAY